MLKKYLKFVTIYEVYVSFLYRKLFLIFLAFPVFSQLKYHDAYYYAISNSIS